MDILKKILLEGNFAIRIGSAAYSKELITQNGIYYNEKHSCGEDTEFIFKILTKSNQVIFVNKFLHFYVLYKGKPHHNFDIYLAYINIMELFNKSLPRNYQTKLFINRINEMAIVIFLTILRGYHDALEKPPFRKLISHINQKYPGVFENALFRLRSLKGGIRRYRVKNILSFSLFQISPRMCLWLRKFYKRFFKLKK